MATSRSKKHLMESAHQSAAACKVECSADLAVPVAVGNDADGVSEWQIDDELVHLREWGTERTHLLPACDAEQIIGASDSGCLGLPNSTRHISNQHAKLTRADGYWMLKDLQSTNRIRVDGAARGQ